jgi:hypothetical protein
MPFGLITCRATSDSRGVPLLIGGAAASTNLVALLGRLDRLDLPLISNCRRDNAARSRAGVAKSSIAFAIRRRIAFNSSSREPFSAASLGKSSRE